MTSTKPVTHPLESVVGEDAMAALGRFRLLTILQLVAVTGRDRKTLEGRIRQLVTHGYVRRHEFRPGHFFGRYSNAYSLTRKGCDWLGDGHAKPLSEKTLSVSQAPHKSLIIDTLIAADKWARHTGQTAPAFRIDRVDGSTRLVLPSKTADADAVIELADTQQHRRFYIVEVYCDYLHGANSKPFDKLPPYVTAGVGHALDVAVGIDLARDIKSALVLVICDSPSMRDRVRKGLPKRDGLPPLDKQTWQRFLFKSADELADFGKGWHLVDGKRRELPT